MKFFIIMAKTRLPLLAFLFYAFKKFTAQFCQGSNCTEPFQFLNNMSVFLSRFSSRLKQSFKKHMSSNALSDNFVLLLVMKLELTYTTNPTLSWKTHWFHSLEYLLLYHILKYNFKKYTLSWKLQLVAVIVHLKNIFSH